jgi:hypothetical protein
MTEPGTGVWLAVLQGDLQQVEETFCKHTVISGTRDIVNSQSLCWLLLSADPAVGFVGLPRRRGEMIEGI